MRTKLRMDDVFSKQKSTIPKIIFQPLSVHIIPLFSFTITYIFSLG